MVDTIGKHVIAQVCVMSEGEKAEVLTLGNISMFVMNRCVGVRKGKECERASPLLRAGGWTDADC